VFADKYPLDPTRSLSENLADTQSIPNLIVLIMWELHYLHRGFVTPWFMRFSTLTIPLFIDGGTFAGNAIITYSVASFVGAATYPTDWVKDPRFIIGCVLYVVGYVTNKWADIHLRGLRKPGDTGYVIPTAGLFHYITCPNYFGETLEWTGVLLVSWTWGAVVWLAFVLSTFIPRSIYNHRWYHSKFPDYPPNRKRLIPFIF